MKATDSLSRILLTLCLMSLILTLAAGAAAGQVPGQVPAGRDATSNCPPPQQKSGLVWAVSPCPPPPPPPPTCSGTTGEWHGCRGNGCAVCDELVAGYPYYFENHPLCSPNTTCGGQYYECNADCPQPTPDDLCDEPGDVNLNGIPGDIADAVLLTQFLSCDAELTDQQIANSDVIADCLVDQADADCLLDPDCVIQSCTCATPEVTACRCSEPGDVNLNGIPAEIADSVLLGHYLACEAELDPEQITNSDVNADCAVDQNDVDCMLDPGCEIQVCTCGHPEVPVCRCASPGDTNGNGFIEIADVTYLNSFLCSGGDAPDPLANGDVDGDCDIDAADSALLLDIVVDGGDPAPCVCDDPVVLPCGQ